MSEPRKPVFGFLWAKPDPDAPVDGAYRQVRPVRITPRGPVRLLCLWVSTAVTIMFVATVVMADLVAPVPVMVVLTAAIAASACFLVLRGWVVGTFVSDDAVRIETVFSRTDVPWADVASIETSPARGPFLGLPLPVAGERVEVVRRGGQRLGTHVYQGSPDLWLRPEAFDIARLRLGTWRDQA